MTLIEDLWIQYYNPETATLMYFLMGLGGLIGLSVIYVKNKNKAFLMLTFACVFLTIWSLVMYLSFIYSSEFLFRINNINFALIVLFFIVFVDLVRNNSVTVFRMCLASANIMVILYLMLLPDSVQMLQFESFNIPYWHGLNLYASYFMLYEGLFFVFHCFFMIFKNAPKSLKFEATMVMIGGAIFAIGTFIASLLMNIILLELLSSIGIIIPGLLLILRPQLLYVLPFKVHRIVIIEHNTGTILFNYAWTDLKIEDELVGGLLVGLQQLSLELLKSREIESIKLKNGVLLLKTSNFITAGLVTTSSSSYLRECFYKFIAEFENRNQKMLLNKMLDKNNYIESLTLIKEFFGNIPNHRSK